ncbi:hypothetical protein [Mucilaginibacter polytrichastri]|uniref:Uncharacterized protein n=1 Tax=Mucilaginibacter polytrichastri TaxID=1302689 RepID=A0A1Q6A2F5_9SPHI|nr:hypothetical protein [Mucilaginibacter polytrichastri]OKS88152.1 hypothetical protein RG47T_3616 [Mucilaginibacter polytrichastri]SFT09141.1 hypothetical protein SAMN04487890_11090 [Mucilaginibacter polytrichastri]
MTSIKNVQPLSAEKLFDLLKTDFADYINQKLGSNLAIEYAHVFDEINVSFPEVIEGPALNITVTDVELTVTLMATESDYNAELLEEHLISFLEEKAG